jgi:hypothetical protein
MLGLGTRPNLLRYCIAKTLRQLRQQKNSSLSKFMKNSIATLVATWSFLLVSHAASSAPPPSFKVGPLWFQMTEEELRQALPSFEPYGPGEFRGRVEFGGIVMNAVYVEDKVRGGSKIELSQDADVSATKECLARLHAVAFVIESTIGPLQPPFEEIPRGAKPKTKALSARSSYAWEVQPDRSRDWTFAKGVAKREGLPPISVVMHAFEERGVSKAPVTCWVKVLGEYRPEVKGAIQ